MSTNVEHARPTRTDRSTDDPDATATSTADSTASTEPSAPTDPTAASPRAAAAPEPTSDATPRPAPSDPADDSWTRRCQRQFEPRATDRLANLVDEENLVVVSPGGE